MREPNGGLFDLEPLRQRRFAGSKVAMDQKGGCGILLHIPQTIRAANSYQPVDCRTSSERRSEIGCDRLWYRERRCSPKEGARIIGADQLCERAFRCARQLRNARDPNLAHSLLILPEALDGVPGRRKGTGVL